MSHKTNPFVAASVQVSEGLAFLSKALPGMDSTQIIEIAQAVAGSRALPKSTPPATPKGPGIAKAPIPDVPKKQTLSARKHTDHDLVLQKVKAHGSDGATAAKIARDAGIKIARTVGLLIWLKKLGKVGIVPASSPTMWRAKV